jgi:hypothetical protein
VNAFEFMSGNPLLTLLLVYIVARYGFRCWNRLMRHLNIRKHGWPPAHLDADGDFEDDQP